MSVSEKAPLRYLLRPYEVSNRPDLPVLSVYRDHGVVRKDSRTDNFNKTPEDISRYQVVRPGDLVVNKMKAWQGSLAISNHLGIVSPDYLVCSVSSLVHAQYLHFLLRSAPLVSEYVKLSKGIRPSQWRLYWEDLATIRVALPAKDEQRRIADLLDAETSRLIELSQALSQLRTMLIHRREVAVHSLVTGLDQDVGMVQSGLQWASVIPSHWRAVRLSLLAVMGSGHTPSRSHPEWWENCTIPWITTGEVSQVRDDRREVITDTRERISSIGMANSSAELHPAGTVVLCRTASAGYSAVMGVDMATSQDFVTWTCGPKLDPYYLLWCLRAMRSDLLGRLAMGSTHKTIYVPDLQMLRVPLPPIRDQRQIVEKIRENNARVDAAVDAIDRQLALLAERQQALIAVAVTGQVDVTSARGLAT
ncbi:restriction endonuclease subunit S [Micromonospora chalcea]|uniref:restriction endonuclease subunit S n=1 Tax=Micromonospora chalcea TaxID=1874 RepID=UPI00332582F6